MTKLTAGLLVLFALTGCATTTRSTAMTTATTSQASTEQQALIELSRQKWLWMAGRDMDRLELLFHPSARFVHMGATLNTSEELDVIRTGKIQYKRADISEASAEVFGETAIVYSRLRLLAEVGGNEVTNPFSVTETYLKQGNRWQLAAMSFTRLLGE